jgi:hypothetical protein
MIGAGTDLPMLKRNIQRAGLTFGAILAAVLFFVAGAALRLLMGPISLGPFAGAIEDSLNRSLTGLVVRFDQAVLEWSRDEGQINLIILGTNVFDSSGRIVAQAPKSDLDFDAASLLSGDFALKSFALLGVQLTAVRDADGALQLGFGQIGSDVDLLEVIRNTLEQSDAGGGSLDTFSIRDARVAFRDESSGLFIVSPEAELSVENDDGQFTALFEAVVEISGAPAEVSMRAALDGNGMPGSGTVDIRGLDLAALAVNSARFAPLADYALLSNIRANYRLDATGAVAEASFAFSGSGTMKSPLREAPHEVETFEITGTYYGADERIVLENARIEGPSGSALMSGEMHPVWNGEALASLAVDLQASDIRLVLPELFAVPLVLSSARVAAEYVEETRTVNWEQLSFEGESLYGVLQGRTAFPADTTPAVAVTGTVNALAVEDLLRYWPVSLARGARGWVSENFLVGSLGPIAIATDIPAGALADGALPDESVRVEFPVESATIDYITGLTLLSEVSGNAVLSGDAFRMTISAGKIGTITASDGEVVIPTLHMREPPGDIRGRLSGAMADVLAVIDMEPLRYPTRFNVVPSAIEGNAEVAFDLTVPLRRNLEVGDVRIAVTVHAEGLGLPLNEERTLSDATAEIFIENGFLTAAGNGSVNNVPVEFSWKEIFAPDGITSSRVTISGRLDEAARARLGLMTPDWLVGPIGATAAFSGERFKFTQAEVRADLTDVAAEIESISFSKPPGESLQASGTVLFEADGGMSVADVRVAGDAVALNGELSLDEAGSLVRASLPTVRYGSNADFALDMEAIPGESPSWRIRGARLDARPMFADDESEADSTESDDDGELAPISVDMDLDEVLITDDVTLSDVAFRLDVGEGEHINDFHIDATWPDGGVIEGRFSDANGNRSLTLASDRAGQFVDIFAGFPSVVGGRIAISANFEAGASVAASSVQDYSGTIAMNDFTLVDQPFMARLFSVGSLDGPLRLMQGSGIPFAEFEAPFVARGGRISLLNGRASGIAMGVSFQGVIDRDNGTMDINGSLVPVFGLNNMLGALPIVGDLLVSKDAEGIIGMTYRAHGDMDEAQVTVNPLSVLTPGIFRRIFEFGGPPQMEDIPAAPAAAPAVQAAAPESTSAQQEVE